MCMFAEGKHLNEFTLDSYQEIILELRNRGYKIRTFQNADANQRHLILRHDIDMSLSASLQMAKAEAQIQATSVYFVLLRSEFYNPWTPESKKVLLEIESLGHQVGLHLDASLYGESSLERGAAKEMQHLGNLLGHDIEMISFHRPAEDWVGSKEKIAGYDHAYRDCYVNDIGYCSDSRGVWRFGHPLKHRSIEIGAALQLLTHPIWWVMPGGNPKEKLKNFLISRSKRIDNELGNQCSIHTPSDNKERYDP